MLRKRGQRHNTRQRNAVDDDVSGIDIPWPIWLFFALMFALVPFAEKPQPMTAEQGWYARH